MLLFYANFIIYTQCRIVEAERYIDGSHLPVQGTYQAHIVKWEVESSWKYINNMTGKHNQCQRLKLIVLYSWPKHCSADYIFQKLDLAVGPTPAFFFMRFPLPALPALSCPPSRTPTQLLQDMIKGTLFTSLAHVDRLCIFHQLG